MKKCITELAVIDTQPQLISSVCKYFHSHDVTSHASIAIDKNAKSDELVIMAAISCKGL